MYSLYKVNCRTGVLAVYKEPIKGWPKSDYLKGPSSFYIITNKLSKIEELILEELKESFWWNEEDFIYSSKKLIIESIERLPTTALIDKEYFSEIN